MVKSIEQNVGSGQSMVRRFVADRQSIKDQAVQVSASVKRYQDQSDIRGTAAAPALTTEARRMDARQAKFDSETPVGRVKALRTGAGRATIDPAVDITA